MDPHMGPVPGPLRKVHALLQAKAALVKKTMTQGDIAEQSQGRPCRSGGRTVRAHFITTPAASLPGTQVQESRWIRGEGTMIIDSIMNLVTRQVTSSLAGRLGTFPSAVHAGLGTSVAALLAGIANRTADCNFIRQVFNLVKNADTQNILD